MDDVDSAGRRQYWVVSIAYFAQEMLLSRNNMLMGSTYGDGARILRSVASNAELEHRYLSINRSDQMAGWMRDWSRSNPVRLNIKQGASFVSDSFSMDDALNLLVTHSLIVADLPAASFSISHPSVYFVLSNALGPLFRLLHTTVGQYSQVAVQQSDTMQTWALSLTITSLLILALVVMLVVRPTVYTVENNKEEVLVLFTDIPPTLLQQFSKKCERRLLQLIHSRDHGRDENDDNEWDEGDEETPFDDHSEGEQGDEQPLTSLMEATDDFGASDGENAPQDIELPPLLSRDALSATESMDSPRRSSFATGPVDPLRLTRVVTSPSPTKHTLAHDEFESLREPASRVRASDVRVPGRAGDSQDLNNSSAIRNIIAKHQKRQERKRLAAEKKTTTKSLNLSATMPSGSANTASQPTTSSSSAGVSSGKSRQGRSLLQQGRLRRTRHLTMLKVLAYVAITTTYFAVSYVQEVGQHLDFMQSAPPQLRYSSDRRWRARWIPFNLRAMLTQNLTTPSNFRNYPYSTAADILFEIQKLTDEERALAYGSDVLGINAPDDAWIKSQLFRNACVFPTVVMPPGCTTFASGVMARGLHTAINDFVQTARTVLNTDLDPTLIQNVTIYSANATLYTAPWQYLNTMHRDFLRGALLEATTRYGDFLNNLFADLFNLRVGLLTGFIVGTFVLYVVFYNPLVYRLNDESKRTSAMLLLIPPQVVEHMDKIRIFVDKLYASGDYS
eukprot:TRINITY_DN5642_c0_g1_i10.p1 TRINITY_DN5642_c0_g1~~TRINITY_DN5642_c0_g1_i10.p1  ORF type:complete len:804 (-),score=195.75 TRINITY_DN5642_c0_g1_i10:184-2379(-)